MSILNLGLQCVGLAREKMPDEYESEAAKCNSLSELRKMAEKKMDLQMLLKTVSHL